ncbi:MAG: hypothetical protein IPL33_15555 [Sphingobacteriales bacterium]|nr:hypothetical protein [Sphingobacteriales bacterium]
MMWYLRKSSLRIQARGFLLTFCLGLLVAWAAHTLTALSEAPKHDYHSSICQIDHNATEKTLEIAIGLFANDLRDAVIAATGDTINLDTGAAPDPYADPAISYYLAQHFSLRINGKAVEWQWVGKEIAPDQVWCYVVVPQVRRVKQLEVTNTVLFELFDDQINWVHLKAAGKKGSLALQKGNASGNL